MNNKKGGEIIKKNKNFKIKFYLFTISIYVLIVGYANVIADSFEKTSYNLKNTTLIPSGQAIAMKLKTNGVLVVGVKNNDKYPAKKCGIKNGDIIKKVNDVEVLNTIHFQKILDTVKNNEITVSVERDGEILKFKTKPILTNNENYEMGMWLRDSAAGIGTVSFYSNDKKHFYALGHPVTDSDTEKNYEIRKGTLEIVDIKGAKKSNGNSPGELVGTMTNYEIGTLITNTESGIYGDLKNTGVVLEKPMEILPKSEVKLGKAYIMSTVDQNGVGKYEIEIAKITDNENKDFIICITDKSLLSKTGGIVRGMSGSPIIQNNKIVGAVTHVLLNDQTKGYGISVEKMLDITKK